MSDLPKATKLSDLIKGLRQLGWTGPHKPRTGKRGRHPSFMQKENRTVKLPNPHGSGDIGEGLLKIILSQAGISITSWLGKDGDKEDD